MTMAYHSGQTRTIACPACGRRVKQQEMVIAMTLQKQWMGDAHESPCGLPCMAGGLRGPNIDLKQVHRKGSCPRCSP